MKKVFSASLCVALAGLLGCATPETPMAEQPQAEQPEASESEVVKIGYWPPYEEGELEKNKLKFYLVDPEENKEIAEMLIPSRNAEQSAVARMDVPVEWITRKGQWKKYSERYSRLCPFDEILSVTHFWTHSYIDISPSGILGVQKFKGYDFTPYQVVRILKIQKKYEEDTKTIYRVIDKVQKESGIELCGELDEKARLKLKEFIGNPIEYEPYTMNLAFYAISCSNKKAYDFSVFVYPRNIDPIPKELTEIRDDKLVGTVCNK